MAAKVRRKPSLKDWIIVGVCLLYVISPVDAMPEVALGPLGLGDDVLALIYAARRLMAARRD